MYNPQTRSIINQNYASERKPSSSFCLFENRMLYYCTSFIDKSEGRGKILLASPSIVSSTSSPNPSLIHPSYFFISISFKRELANSPSINRLNSSFGSDIPGPMKTISFRRSPTRGEGSKSERMASEEDGGQLERGRQAHQRPRHWGARGE